MNKPYDEEGYWDAQLAFDAWMDHLCREDGCAQCGAANRHEYSPSYGLPQPPFAERCEEGKRLLATSDEKQKEHARKWPKDG